MVSTSGWSPLPEDTLAVIDIGSNTSRVTVFSHVADGHYEAIADSRAALRLLRVLSGTKRLDRPAVEPLLAALRDFQTVARGAGAQKTIALAAYTVRNSSVAGELTQLIEQETGIQVEVIDGDREAELGFLGAVYGMDAEDGALLDLGGGSLEVAYFKQRSLTRSWSLPLGALLMNDQFLASDPPTKSEVQSLETYVLEILKQGRIRRLKPTEHLVGTGGTVRNLAKIDRATRRYPIPQLHGYRLPRRGLKDLSRELTATPRAEVGRIAGLNPDRRDSIAAGSVVLHTVLRALKATALEVSGQGLREGYAIASALQRLPSPRAVRKVAIEALAARFSTWDHRAAQRRSALVAALQALLDRESGSEMQEMLVHAAWVLDIGKSVNYVDRFQHTADVLLATNLAGFNHRQIAVLAGAVRAADKRRFDWRSLRPVLSAEDEIPQQRAGLILALADEIEKRLPPDYGIPVVFHDVDQNRLGLDLPAPFGGRLSVLAERFPQVFGWELDFEGTG
jgi:exopolyphosphatase/guanosine-5'-triphosphate,3'-diphosphate pyrophosphatase